MRTRTIQVRTPVHGDGPAEREWTEVTIDACDLMVLLGMPGATRLISMRCHGTEIVITVEEPEASCSES